MTTAQAPHLTLAERKRGARGAPGRTPGRTLADFAEAYADTNERDFEALERAVVDGRIAAERGR